MALIYIVEDDKNIQEIEMFALKNIDYAVEGFECARDFYKRLYEKLPDLVLLDVMLPDEDGLEIVKKLRKRPDTMRVPIIMVTAKTTEIDKVKGLDMGADDYITKPFNPEELIARVNAIIRRCSKNNVLSEKAGLIKAGNLTIDDELKKVVVDGKEVKLTPTEYNILKFLTQNKGKVYSIDEIYTNIWEEESFAAENIIAVHIRHIREKIEVNPKEPKYLKVIWGVGYKVENL